MEGSFDSLSSKITQFLYGRAKNDRNVITKILDDLNSFNYKYTVVANPKKAVLLINQCCTLISPEDFELSLKCCQLITNLVLIQGVLVEGRTLTLAVQWCLSVLSKSQNNVEVLVAVDALLRKHNQLNFISELVKHPMIISFVVDDRNLELSFLALQCLEACTCPPEDLKMSTLEKSGPEVKICFDIFLSRLLKSNGLIDELVLIKMYILCLRGLQNIIIQEPGLLDDNLGIILGVIKSYMLLGINGIEFLAPEKLMPSILTLPESSPNLVRDKSGGKVPKHRKCRTQPTMNKVDKNTKWNDDHRYSSSSSSAIQPDVTSREGLVNSSYLKTSDSDFSDTEGKNTAKITVMLGRVRQAALSFLLWTVKSTNKSTMFSYWPSFIPENPLSNEHNLVVCVLKDSSTKGRMAALNVLLVLLSSAKLYLAQAEKGENLSFTPFSVMLGLIIKELHRCLSLALNERSIPVLNMVLKCLAALVQATPYPRLDPGLITKVVRNVKYFIYHKDPTVQVTALIVLGCVLASEPSVPETTEAFIKYNSNKTEVVDKTSSEKLDDSVEFAQFSSGDEESTSESSNILGESTSKSRNIPWLLERCLFNLGVETDSEQVIENSVCTAVKMESLQIISVMSRNHFEQLLGPHMNFVLQALDAALSNKYSDVRLHAGRAVDFLNHAVNRNLENGSGANVVSLNQYVIFLQGLLSGSLTSLLQNEQHEVLRAIGCDCLGSIGPKVFEQLPRDKQLLCVTMLFACSRNEDNGVKGAAVRALAIYVMHPSLREDLGFVMDTAEAIHRILQDQNFSLRVKCSWSLGNLSDALVLNKNNPSLNDELPKSLMIKLLKSTVQASNDSDKIKMNTVRALGNLLQLIDADMLDDDKFREIVEEAINVLVKCCTSGSNMKVRWNSCCAIGNVMRNNFLFLSTIKWQENVFNALTDLVMNFRNFKVRINAAVALASPGRREYYQQFYQPVFAALVQGLETSQNMEDFKEYKHQDHLVEQICISLSYLITLLTKDDIIHLKESIYADQLTFQMQRVWEKILPEKATSLLEARSCLASLINENDLSSEQIAVLNRLNNIFKHD